MYREVTSASTSDLGGMDEGTVTRPAPRLKPARAAAGAQGATAPTPATVHSFDELCLVHYERMTLFARRLACDDQARADDIVQDAMIKAMRAWPRWRPQGDPASYALAWLYKIVNTTFLKSTRSKKCAERRQEMRWRDLLEAVHPSVDVPASVTSVTTPLCGAGGLGYDGRKILEFAGVHPTDHDTPLGDEVTAALGALSVDHREVVMLRYVSGLECEEIAVALGIPKNTVFTRLARARAILERALKNYARREYRIERRTAAARGGTVAP